MNMVVVHKSRSLSGAAHRRQLILGLVAAAAAQGEPCPSDEALADQAGFAATCSARRTLRYLADAGEIEIRRYGHFRRVRIVATGDQTAAPPPRLADLYQPSATRPRHTVREIFELVVAEAGTCRKSVLAGSRYHDHVRARQVAQALAKRAGWGVTHIARVLGCDHSTVNHNCRVLPIFAAREAETGYLLRRMEAKLFPPQDIAA